MKRSHIPAILGIASLVLMTCAPAAAPTARLSPTATPPVSPTLTSTPTTSTTEVARPVPTPTAAPISSPKSAPVTTGPKYGGVLRHRLLSDVEGWDPGKAYWRIAEVTFWAYPRLYSFNRGKAEGPQCELYPIQPELATDFKWVDDVTLDVSIRQGVRLPQKPPLNGREVTADDVVFTFKRLFFNVNAAPLASLAVNTAEVTKVGRSTVRFKLKSPDSEYPSLAFTHWTTAIMPPETLGPPGDASGTYGYTGYQTAAYGRFRPINYAPGVAVDLERNPDFFTPGLPYLDGVSLKVIPEESTFLAAMRARRLDSGATRSSITIGDVAKSRDVPQIICPAGHVVLGFMNMNRPEFKDVNVRRAISMAIDREALNRMVFFGLASQGHTFVSPVVGREWLAQLQDYPPEVRRWLSHDVKGAQEVLAKSAYPKGFTSKIAFTTAQAGMLQAAEAISGMLDDIGITLKLDGMPFPDYNAMLADYPWDKPATRHGGIMLGLIAAPYLNDVVAYTAPGLPTNRSVITDTRVDNMLDELRRTRDVVKKQQLMKQFQVYLADLAYLLPLPSGPNAELHQPYVKGFYFKAYGNQDGEVMRDAWLDR